MTTITRRKVFETNSSSTHSLTIRTDTAIIQPKLDPRETCLVITTGDFGWEERIFDDIETKLSYLYTDILNYHPADQTAWAMQHLINCVKINLGVDLQCEIDDKDSWNGGRGYIDHQSVGLTRDSIWHYGDDEQTQTALFDFLFRQGSVLKTDNDNH